MKVADAGIVPTEVVCGCCRGVDRLGEDWAKKRAISVAYFLARWRQFGKSAGFLRKREMAEHGETLIAIMEKMSKGTANMIKLAKDMGLAVHVLELS